VVLFVSAREFGVIGQVPPGISKDLLISMGLTGLTQTIAAATNGAKPTLLPIIGTIPNSKLAGMRYALKVVSVDEELVARQAAAAKVETGIQL